MKSPTCIKCGGTRWAVRFQFGRPHRLCRDCANTRAKRWTSGNATKRKKSANKSRRDIYKQLRVDAINRYGAKCACCGDTRLEFLNLDHVNGDGSRHRREIGTGAYNILLWLKQNDYPDTIQLLCWNCNCSKGIYGYCPHEYARSLEVVR